MDIGYLLGILALGTMGALIVFAQVSKKRVEERKADGHAPKSSLAKDGPNG